MTILTASDCLDRLLGQTPIRLEALPTCSGLYGLWDPFGTMRYIGSTQDLRDRVWSRHVAGSEGYSHKLAQELNQHLFFVDSETLAEQPGRAKMVRALRQRFIRGHYRATFVPVPLTKAPLEGLERQVIGLAKPENRLWNDRTVAQTRFDGPLAKLLRDFVTREVHSDAQRAALRTQMERWKQLQAA